MTHFLDVQTAFPTTIANETSEDDLHPLIHNEAGGVLNQVQAELAGWRTFVVTSARFAGGALGGAFVVTDGAIAIATNAITSAAAFAHDPAPQVGQWVRLAGAGGSGGQNAGASYAGQITAVVPASNLMVVRPQVGSGAGATVSGAELVVAWDDTAPFVAAMAAASAVAGGEVYIPPGAYGFGGNGFPDGNQNALLVPPSNVTIRGGGMGATTLYGISPYNLIFARDKTGIRVRDLTLNNAGSDTADCFKMISGDTHIHVERVEAIGGFAGFQLMGATDYSLVDCYAHDQDGFGGGGFGFSLAERHGGSFDSFGTARGQLVNCRAANDPSAGFRLNGEDDTGASLGINYVTELQLTNCHALACAVGFFVNLAKWCALTNCQARGSTATTGFDLQLCEAVVLTNCHSLSGAGHGFRFYGSSHCKALGCVARDNGSGGVNTRGIVLADLNGVPTTYSEVVGCSSGNTSPGGYQTHGIETQGTAAHNHVVGGEVLNNGTAGVAITAADVSAHVVGSTLADTLPNGLDVTGDVWFRAGVLRIRSANVGDTWFGTNTTAGLANSLFTIDLSGAHQWGPGTAVRDTFLRRSGVGLLRADASKVLADNGIGVGNSAAASSLSGNLVRKMQVFDASGNSLGYVPIYDGIT